MNYIKRAIQSLWAKKGRSIIMITVFSAILIFVLAGLTIRSGAELATTNAKKVSGQPSPYQRTERQCSNSNQIQIQMMKAVVQIQVALNRHPST